MEKVKNFTFSPFSFFKGVAFQGWIIDFNAYEASLADVRSYVLVFAKALF
jgi:hypothetical protein